MDDRDERAGVKFKDADLLGVPIRVTVGNAWPRRAWSRSGARRDRTDRRIARGQLVEATPRARAVAERRGLTRDGRGPYARDGPCGRVITVLNF